MCLPEVRPVSPRLLGAVSTRPIRVYDPLCPPPVPPRPVFALRREISPRVAIPVCLPATIEEKREVSVEKVAEQPTVCHDRLSRSQATIVTCIGEDRRQVKALVDTGANYCYIAPSFVASHALKTYRYLEPVSLTLFDGSPARDKISEYVEEVIEISGIKSRAKFEVTPLASSAVVLGWNWLQAEKIVIDCAARSLRRSDIEGRAEQSASIPVFSSILADNGSVVSKIAEMSSVSVVFPFATFPNNVPLGVRKKMAEYVYPPKVVETTAESAKLCAVAPPILDELDDYEAIPGFDDLEATPDEIAEIITKVPEEYQDFIDVFQPRKGKGILAPHREFDMKIELRDDAKLRVAPLYELSAASRDAIRDTVDREIKAGRIRPSNARYGSPTFTVSKKDGTHRMVVDYRVLNQATIPNAYPLPLISSVMSQLQGSKFFSKFDIVSAYQLLRMAEGSEQYTAFRTEFGMFESLVLRDGLRNAPSAFQQFLNDLFADLLGSGVIVYIDDILVHAVTLEEMRRLTHIVLERLRGASLFLKASKCEFEQDSITFLGFRISAKGVEANREYVDAIASFPEPKNLKETRRFVGMASFYRRFVPNFSKIARPLNQLTGKNVPFVWTDVERDAFQKLKVAMTTSPVLAHFIPGATTFVQTDASIYGWGFVISQVNPENGEEHPIAMESGSFSAAQFNYTISEKEFLAIVEAFRRKRHLLMQVSSTVVTDHLNLTYWMEPRQLSQRQARWVDLLSGFDLHIVYRPGSKAEFPDALSRRPDYSEGMDPDLNLIQALPKFDEGDTSSPTIGHLLRAVDPQVEENANDDHGSVGENVEDGVSVAEIVEAMKVDKDIDMVRDELDALAVDVSYSGDMLSQYPQLVGFTKRMGHLSPTIVKSSEGILWIDNRRYIPKIDMLRATILNDHHDAPLAGHHGIGKTLELVQRQYCWFGLRRDVELYVRGCAICQRTKPSRQRPHGLLQSLEVADMPWSSISMDFIEELPMSNGFNSILVVVDRLTKWGIFIPTTTTLNASGLAELLIDNVFAEHGLPVSIISDRGSKFTSKLWAAICAALKVKVSLSTAFHPQTDGQTERVNQVLEHYVRLFTNYKQDDWSTLLQRAAFSYNNSNHSAIQMSPFMANFGYHPRWTNDIAGSAIPIVAERIKNLSELHEMCKKNIETANEEYARQYDRKRREQMDINVGDLVLLSTENLRTVRPMKKFDNKYCGPFKVSAKISSTAYMLELPATMKCHNVFHVSLLKLFQPPTIEGQAYEAPGPIEVDGDEEEWEVKAVVDSRLFRRRLQYLVEWIGYEGTPDAASWQPASDLENSQEMVDDFHAKNPDKPGP